MELNLKLWLLVACGAMAMIQCAPSGENRPYEFGFNIGTQHREEKKDENGLITGEYGFWTADNYYNVFKYATDEEGRFRILSRKRIPVTTTTTPAPTPDPSQLSKSADGSEDGANGAGGVPTTTTTERVKIYQFEYDTKNETNPEAHGHKEMGFSDTSKMGDYYWDGPDGYRRTITYVADDDGGYRPIIKQTKTPA